MKTSITRTMTLCREVPKLGRGMEVTQSIWPVTSDSGRGVI